MDGQLRETHRPLRKTYYWLTGQFVCDDNAEDTDQWALEHGYASIVPCMPDYTSHEAIRPLARIFQDDGAYYSNEKQ